MNLDGSIKMVEQRRQNTKSIYWGETSFEAYIRGKQHLKALQKPKSHQENAFVRHRETGTLAEPNKFFNPSFVSSLTRVK